MVVVEWLNGCGGMVVVEWLNGCGGMVVVEWLWWKTWMIKCDKWGCGKFCRVVIRGQQSL